jgi:hypothetical protein
MIFVANLVHNVLGLIKTEAPTRRSAEFGPDECIRGSQPTRMQLAARHEPYDQRTAKPCGTLEVLQIYEALPPKAMVTRSEEKVACPGEEFTVDAWGL